MRTLRLRTFLALLLTSAALLSFGIVATLVLLVRLPQVEQRARDQAQITAQETNRLLDRYTESVEHQIEPLLHALRVGRAAPDLQFLLDAIVGEGVTFDALTLVGPDGRVQAYGLPRARGAARGMALRGLDLSANRLYRAQRALQRPDATAPAPLWSDTYLSVLSGQMTVGVAMAAGPYMVIGELSQARMLTIMQNIGYTDQATVLVLDRRGKRLASSSANAPTVMDYGGYPAFQAISRSQAPPPYFEVLGQRLLVGGVVSPKLGWVVLATLPAGMDLYSYRLTVLVVLLGYGGALLISLALAPVWATRLSRPFRALALKASRIAQGVRATDEEDPGRVVEFRQLAADLDDMAAAIQERQTALRRSEARLKATLEHTPSVAVQWYDREGTVLYWNPASAEMYGIPAERAIGVKITEDTLGFYESREQAAAFVQTLQEIERSGQPVGPVEFAMRHADGRPITILASTFAIPGDGGQSVFVCMDVDITQRKLAEQALRDNELKLEAIFHASPAPMSVSDVRQSYRVINVNRAWEQLYQRSRAEVMGRNGQEFGIWAEPADRLRYLQLLEADGRVDGFETWCLDGKGRSILCRLSALITEIGDERLVLMMTVDITEQRRIERELQQLNAELEQRVETRTEELRLANQRLESTVLNLQRAQEQLVESEKLAALGNLVAGVAHELNTPIGNGVMAITTLDERLRAFRAVPRDAMRYSDLQGFAEAVEMACSISLRNMQRAAALVSSFKQVAVDQTSAQRRRFELREVVDEVLLTLQPTLRGTPYRIELQVPEALVLDSYPGALGQVLTNLIGNAVMHAFDGREGGIITIQAAVGEGDEIVFSVADNGRGIPEALQKKVFEPFFTTKLGQGGTGLGLHIVFNAVTHVLGGQVSLRSPPGQGTVFELRIPRVAPAAG
ncbi:MAG: PAS domain S-box protein [Hylemonella sp.]|uniref:PAS domain S-box protein n=1 Tax=Hylemonella sp. TaxID=2066020 RepID=UPI0022C1309D|nr:PAS domain S-box protein [Hylemonella sp.]MCZ8251183.1 PAS domain S-box protein [Hylemonella sp.]